MHGSLSRPAHAPTAFQLPPTCHPLLDPQAGTAGSGGGTMSTGCRVGGPAAKAFGGGGYRGAETGALAHSQPCSQQRRLGPPRSPASTHTPPLCPAGDSGPVVVLVHGFGVSVYHWCAGAGAGGWQEDSRHCLPLPRSRPCLCPPTAPPVPPRIAQEVQRARAGQDLPRVRAGLPGWVARGRGRLGRRACGTRLCCCSTVHEQQRGLRMKGRQAHAWGGAEGAGGARRVAGRRSCAAHAAAHAQAWRRAPPRPAPPRLPAAGFGWSSKPLADYNGYNLWRDQIAGTYKRLCVSPRACSFLQLFGGARRAAGAGATLAAHRPASPLRVREQSFVLLNALLPKFLALCRLHP